MFDEIIASSKIMEAYVGNLGTDKMALPNVWKRVVSRVKSSRFESEDSEKRMPIGQRLAGNTRVIDLKNEVLLIETDHSGWIQYLKIYQNFIIEGLRRELPDLKIKSFAFKLSGTEVQLSESYEEQVRRNQAEMNKKIEEEEKILNEKFKPVEKKSGELPPEILEKFESIKKSMLTNTSK